MHFAMIRIQEPDTAGMQRSAAVLLCVAGFYIKRPLRLMCQARLRGFRWTQMLHIEEHLVIDINLQTYNMTRRGPTWSGHHSPQ